MKRKIDYSGDKRYTVEHPRHGRVTVAAPDEASAIYAAGYAWGVDPTRIAFYSNCTAYRDKRAEKRAARAANGRLSELSADGNLSRK